MQGNTTEIDERNLLRLDALLSHGYGLSPQLVMRSKGLSIEAKALYGYLSSFAGAGDTAFPSTSRILEELDISKNRFYKIRKELVSWGFISIETTATSAGLRTVYTLPQNPIAIKTEIDEIANRRNEIKSSLVANLHNEDMVSHKGDSESECLQQSAGNEPCRQSEAKAQNRGSNLKPCLQSEDEGYAYWSVRMAANGIGAILGALFGAIGVLIIPVIIIIAVICTISGGSKSENASVGSLTGDEATIAQYLIDKGVDRTHIAAIMGNMFQESGCHPTALNSSSGAYGICQWLGGRKTGLENLAKEKGKDMSDLSVQLDWFWEEFAESCSGWNKAKYKVFCAQSDLKQCVYLFRSQFERCGESEAADANRLAQAQRIYDALGTSNGTNGIDGNGQDLKKATRRQKDVVNAANTTKSPGQGWCAAWVTNVFQSAGIGYFGGNACDMCRAYCTSTNVRDLKVGMIIADVSHPGTGEAGRLYGHVGIYIGDNKVISNEGAITIKSLQEFVGFYGKGTGCKWGWLGGVDLSK